MEQNQKVINTEGAQRRALGFELHWATYRRTTQAKGFLYLLLLVIKPVWRWFSFCAAVLFFFSFGLSIDCTKRKQARGCSVDRKKEEKSFGSFSDEERTPIKIQ